MPDITSLEMLLRSLIVALPLLVLIVLFFLLAAKRRRGAEAPSPRDGELHAPEPAKISEASAHQRSAAVSEPVADAPVPAPPDQALAKRIAQLEADIARAEDEGATVELAELYLALGRAHMVDGAEGEALSALRSAAGLAALHKAPKVQALARLDLAEVAMSHGDPITACEHWQMARMAFLEAGDRVEGDRIDRRMRTQGCPTDWVLTDF